MVDKSTVGDDEEAEEDEDDAKSLQNVVSKPAPRLTIWHEWRLEGTVVCGLESVEVGEDGDGENDVNNVDDADVVDDVDDVDVGNGDEDDGDEDEGEATAEGDAACRNSNMIASTAATRL